VQTKGHRNIAAELSGVRAKSGSSQSLPLNAEKSLLRTRKPKAEQLPAADDASIGTETELFECLRQEAQFIGGESSIADPSSASSLAENQATQILGYIDGPDAKWRIVGWAQRLPVATQRLDIRLYENDLELAIARAERFRGDLLDAGIGDGNYGFVLPLPPRLFDGLRHKFAIYADDPAGPKFLGEIDIVLPSRPPASLEPADTPSQKAIRLIQIALLRHSPIRDTRIGAYADELTRTMKDIVNAYDYATALGLLYVHLLRRRIDEGGLQSRIHRLSVDPEEFSQIILEVLTSDESQLRHHGYQELAYPDLAPLIAWTVLRSNSYIDL
jgi:hypothetical protein